MGDDLAVIIKLCLLVCVVVPQVGSHGIEASWAGGEKGREVNKQLLFVLFVCLRVLHC